MVWIHGGALVTGESNGYDPANLVRRGVVVMTINYRLGAPDRPGVPIWPAFRAGSQRMISLVPPRPRVIRGFTAAHHCAFWASLASSPVHEGQARALSRPSSRRRPSGSRR